MRCACRVICLMAPCLAGNAVAAPATVGGSPEINDVTVCCQGGIGKTIEGIIRKPGDRPQDTGINSFDGGSRGKCIAKFHPPD
jgi:hypothetical protein